MYTEHSQRRSIVLREETLVCDWEKTHIINQDSKFYTRWHWKLWRKKNLIRREKGWDMEKGVMFCTGWSRKLLKLFGEQMKQPSPERPLRSVRELKWAEREPSSRPNNQKKIFPRMFHGQQELWLMSTSKEEHLQRSGDWGILSSRMVLVIINHLECALSKLEVPGVFWTEGAAIWLSFLNSGLCCSEEGRRQTAGQWWESGWNYSNRRGQWWWQLSSG